MKTLNKILYMACAAAMVILPACSETDAEKDEGKTPRVEYVRYSDPSQANDHITGAFLGETVVLCGSNLGNVQQVWFNDQQAKLNSTLITSNNIVLTIPNTISDNVTNKVKVVAGGGQTQEFDFNVLVPAPLVESLDNEWAAPGTEVTLTGDYIVTDDEYPLAIEFPGGVKVDPKTIEVKDRNSCTFTIPEGAKEGQLKVTSRYGDGYSNFHYRDTRALLFDWDGTHGQALALASGWRDGSKIVTNSFPGIPALDGNYICFNGTKGDYNDAGEDNFSFNHWSSWSNDAGQQTGLDPSTLFDVAHFTDYCLRFEVFVPSSTPWTVCALQMILTKNELGGSNGYIWDDDYPRGMWVPWEKTGSYDTGDKWVTVSVPFSEFNKTRYMGSSSQNLSAAYFKGLTMIVLNGPASELTNVPLAIAVDNIRICPLDEEKPTDNK